VAGGYVAAPELACDIDLWLLAGADHVERRRIRDRVRRHIAIVVPKGGTLHGWSSWEPFIAYEQSELPVEYTDGNLGQKNFHYVGKFQKEGWPLPVQFFIAPYQNVGDLLRDFDISTHQRAKVLASLTEVPWLETTTSVESVPRVTNWDTPATTLLRLEKLSKRYGFNLKDNPDYAKLSALTVDDALRTAA
jgi:hypothetical protein